MNFKKVSLSAGKQAKLVVTPSTCFKILSGPPQSMLTLQYGNVGIVEKLGVSGVRNNLANPVQELYLNNIVDGVVEIAFDTVPFNSSGTEKKPENVGDTHAANVEIVGGGSLTVRAEGMGTAILNIVAPSTGTSSLVDYYDNSIPFRYLDGRFGLGTVPAGFNGLIILDMAGHSGFKFSYFGDETASIGYTISSPTHPINYKHQMIENIGLAIGGLPFGPGERVHTLPFENVNNTSVSILGQIAGGEATDFINIAIVPVDADGNLYQGLPCYFPIKLGPGSPEFFATFNLQTAQGVYDVFGVGEGGGQGGTFIGDHLQPIGAHNYAIVLFWFPAAPGLDRLPWGLTKFEVISSRA